MGRLNTGQPSIIWRGTVDEVFSHRDETPVGATVELKIFDPQPQPVEETATMILMRTWLTQDATDDPVQLQVASQETSEFKRNMNQPRKETASRLLYPEGD